LCEDALANPSCSGGLLVHVTGNVDHHKLTLCIKHQAKAVLRVVRTLVATSE